MKLRDPIMTCKNDMLLGVMNISSWLGGICCDVVALLETPVRRLQYFWSVFQSGYGGKKR